MQLSSSPPGRADRVNRGEVCGGFGHQRQSPRQRASFGSGGTFRNVPVSRVGERHSITTMGYRTYLGQERGAYYLDLCVQRVSVYNQASDQTHEQNDHILGFLGQCM